MHSLKLGPLSHKIGPEAVELCNKTLAERARPPLPERKRMARLSIDAHPSLRAGLFLLLALLLTYILAMGGLLL